MRALPDLSRLEALILPPGCGIIIKKGTWHDFPVSCGPPITVFIINTKEVVTALATMPQAAPMKHGDIFKLRMSDHFKDVKIKFLDPRPIVQRLGLLPLEAEPALQLTDEVVRKLVILAKYLTSKAVFSFKPVWKQHNIMSLYTMKGRGQRQNNGSRGLWCRDASPGSPGRLGTVCGGRGAEGCCRARHQC